MSKWHRAGLIAISIGFISIPAVCFAETLELVTYYPTSSNQGDGHFKSLTVGTDYQGITPNDGQALIRTTLGIGLNDPSEQLEIAGNFELPDTAATQVGTNTVTTGVVTKAGGVRFLHDFGTDNTFLGMEAGNLTLTSTNNTGIGVRVMRDLKSGDGNTAVGYEAMLGPAEDDSNTAVGFTALRNITTGADNTALGAVALSDNTTGRLNTAVGSGAMGRNTTGGRNTALGVNALVGNTTGERNVAVGLESGFSNKIGTGNVFIGYQAGCYETGSNKLYIENSNADSNGALIYGDFNDGSEFVRINGSLKVSVMPDLSGSDPVVKWNSGSLTLGKDLAEFFPSKAGHLGEGTIAALGADGRAVAAAEGMQTLGPTPYLPGVVIDGTQHRIGPTLEEMRVPGRTPVALLGHVTVEVEGSVEVGDLLVAGPKGKAVRWEPGRSVLGYVGLVVQADPKANLATVLVGHQGLQKALDSLQAENAVLKRQIEALEQRVDAISSGR